MLFAIFLILCMILWEIQTQDPDHKAWLADKQKAWRKRWAEKERADHPKTASPSKLGKGGA